MLPDLIHISRAEVEALGLTAADIAEALEGVFAAVRGGRVQFQPKSQLSLGTGHIFQTLMAVSHDRGVVALKWVGMGPDAGAHNLPAVSALICLNDLATGHPLAVIDGEEITLLRTAGLSALAARDLAAPSPRVIGFAGAGAQARSHLMAFVSQFPSIERVICYSRRAESSQSLAAEAESLGLTAQVVTEAETLCRASDILISTIPAAAGLQPSLDARWLKPDALAVMVDLGRSWHPEGFTVFAQIATDALAQMPYPLDATGAPIETSPCTAALESGLRRVEGRQAFCFRGHPAGDLALAILVHDRIRAAAGGVPLHR